MLVLVVVSKKPTKECQILALSNSLASCYDFAERAVVLSLPSNPLGGDPVALPQDFPRAPAAPQGPSLPTPLAVFKTKRLSTTDLKFLDFQLGHPPQQPKGDGGQVQAWRRNDWRRLSLDSRRRIGWQKRAVQHRNCSEQFSCM